MGYTNWSDDFYYYREAERARVGVSAFAYSDDVRRRPVSERQTHAQMNPFNVKRESRDSEAHPESTAVAVIFDVTGSMGHIPVILQKKLPEFHGLLTTRKYLKDPQVLFGAVGDSTCDGGSLQIGQFESGVEMDDDLGRMWLEGGGGSGMEESYQNAIYFMAQHTSCDCTEKRKKKGYLFLIGDEKPYSRVSKKEVEKIMGDTLQADIPLKEVVAMASEKFHIFFLIPSGASHGRDADVEDTWVRTLGRDHVVKIDDPDAVCETIGLLIGLTEGTAKLENVEEDFQQAGISGQVADAVKRAVTPGRKKASRNVRV